MSNLDKDHEPVKGTMGLPEIEIIPTSINDDLPVDDSVDSETKSDDAKFTLRRPRIREAANDAPKKGKGAKKKKERSKKEKKVKEGEKKSPMTRRQAKSAQDETEEAPKKGIDWNKGIDFKDLKKPEWLTLSTKSKGIPVGGNITVDLMPQSHINAVESRQAQRRWLYIFGLTIAVSIMATLFMLAFSTQLKMQLNDELETKETIDLSISRYADVNQTLESESQARNLLNQAAGNEINWNKLFSTISSALPSGTSMSSIAVTNGGTKADAVSSFIVMDLVSSNAMGYPETLEAVRGISGVNAVEVSGMTSGNGGSSVYTMYLTYDTSILTERFSLEEQ